jgi:hypothetical protein
MGHHLHPHVDAMKKCIFNTSYEIGVRSMVDAQFGVKILSLYSNGQHQSK